MRTGTTSLRTFPQKNLRKCSFCPGGHAVVALILSAVFAKGQLAADIVTISTNVASGTSHRPNTNDFIGILTSSSPPQIGGASITLPNIPAGQSFQVGDIAGRDIDATTGSRNWDYLLTLPGNAVAGTGFTNINFGGWAFERSNGNLEASDQLSWQMFLNGSAVAVASSTLTNDFAPQAINLSNAGGSAISQVLVRFSVAQYNASGEWFVSRGTLSANYDAIPEPEMALLAVLGIALALPRRNRRGRLQLPGVSA